jgi:chemotaxis-related protein WspD
MEPEATNSSTEPEATNSALETGAPHSRPASVDDHAVDRAAPPCWLTIGVWGNAEPRCPELEKFVHCHNCPVFHRGGLSLLDREVPPDYGAGWVEALARLKTDARARPVLVFRAGGELFGIGLDALVQVSDWRAIRTIPHHRDPILLGLVNLEGELRLAVSLEVLLDLDRPDPAMRPPKGRMLLLGSASPGWVVPVQEAVTLLDVVLDELKAAPATVENSSSPYVRGMFEWRGHQVGVLDAELVESSFRRRLG